MSILETIIKSRNGDLVKQLAGSFSIDEGQAGAAVAKLLPALTAGLKQNVARPGGLESLLGALSGGDHQRYVDNPAAATEAAGIADGNSILGHILGSKEVSRGVAANAAGQTGIDIGVLKKMLPMVAAMAMGSLSKQQQSGGALSDLAAQGGAGRGLLDSFLDRDNDGSIADDLLGMARKLL